MIMRKIQTRTIVLYGLFIAVIFLLGLTPLGYISLPIAAITTVHIPVIVGGYVLGKKGGAVLGFFFGCWLSFPAFNGLACPQGGYRSFPTAFAVRFRSNSISF